MLKIHLTRPLAGFEQHRQARSDGSANRCEVQEEHRGRHEAEGRDDHRDEDQRRAGRSSELHGRRGERGLGGFGGRERGPQDALRYELDGDVQHSHS
jgi:hypothetical protein